MQQRNTKKSSWLKTALWWVAGTVAAVPITKQVEGHYDVSFFSPAISELWAWMTSMGRWLVRDVTLPFWVVLTLLVLTTLLAVPSLIFIYVKFFEEKLHSTQQAVPLSQDETVAFVVLGKAIQEGHQFGMDDVRQYTRLSRIATQSALDNLMHKQLIYVARDRMHYNYIDLTPMGREHFLELENQSRS